MPLNIARRLGGHSRPIRIGYCASLAALLFLFGVESLQNATADGETRKISLRNTHTKEELTVTYKVNGRYDEDALKRINHILRDWREDKPIRIDPHLVDLIWEVYREVEATEPIAIVCGYRSPGTNAMLRRRSSGVAKFSQHMLGKAMDFYIPGVALDRLREVGLRAARGGVGFYPSSNFVHLDTGSVRHWPRMPEAQLARVMAKGPLTTVAARKQETKTASMRVPNPLAKLFGGEDEEDAETLAAARAAEAKRPAPGPTEKSAGQPVAAATTPAARPATRPTPPQPATFEVASASSRPVELRPARATSLVNGGGGSSANSVIAERGFWQGLPDSGSALANAAVKAGAAANKASAAIQRPAAVASADVAATGSVAPWPVPAREETGPALAYAPASHPATPSRSAATTSARVAPTAPAAQRDTTVAVKRGADQPAQVSAPTAVAPGPAKVGQRFNDPWMRAMIVAPSAGGFMNTSLLGTSDYRGLSPYLHKPATSVMMTFANDPHLGMTTEKFAGTAIVFVSTVTFGQRTASLR